MSIDHRVLVYCSSVLLFVSGCTTRRIASMPSQTEKLNDEVKGRTVDLEVWSDGARRTVRGLEVKLGRNTIEWKTESGLQQQAPFEALVSLRYLSAESPRSRGFWEGAGPGALIGILAGAGAGFARGDDAPCTFGSSCSPSSRGVKAVVGGALGALLGFATGGATGALIGHHDEVRFESEKR